MQSIVLRIIQKKSSNWIKIHLFSFAQLLHTRTNWTIWIMKLWTLQSTIRWHRAVASNTPTILPVYRVKRFWLLVAPKTTYWRLPIVFVTRIPCTNPLTSNYLRAWNATTLTNLQKQTVSDCIILFFQLHTRNRTQTRLRNGNNTHSAPNNFHNGHLPPYPSQWRTSLASHQTRLLCESVRFVRHACLPDPNRFPLVR